MKIVTALFASSLLAVAPFASVQATPSLSGNIGITNNYVWRGVTQTNDQAAVQGGADYDFGNGFTIGAWLSNVDSGSGSSNAAGTEVDLYGAYKIGLGKDMSLDVGAIKYVYPSQDATVFPDFLEAFVKYNFKDLTVGAYYTIDKQGTTEENDLYTMASYAFAVGKDSKVSLLVGNYDFDLASSEDYTHFRVAFTKGEFTFAVDKNDLKNTSRQQNDPRFTLMWAKSFDL